MMGIGSGLVVEVLMVTVVAGEDPTLAGVVMVVHDADSSGLIVVLMYLRMMVAVVMGVVIAVLYT